MHYQRLEDLVHQGFDLEEWQWVGLGADFFMSELDLPSTLQNPNPPVN